MLIHLPVVGPDLPTHARTGLTAIGLRRNGDPIWPVKGGSGDDPDPEPKPDDGDPDPDPDPDVPEGTGDAGKKAIDRMKADRNTARTELKAATAELAKFRKAEQAKADADKSEAEKRTAAEERAEKAELKATRLEVAFEKGLTPTQAKRLVGSTREELEADADQLLKDFPAAPARKKAPDPDPSQGPKGPSTARPTSLGAALGAAMKPKT